MHTGFAIDMTAFAHRGNHLTLGNLSSDRNIELTVMPIERLESIAVIDDDVIAVSTVPAIRSHLYSATGGGIDRTAELPGDIDRPVPVVEKLRINPICRF